MSEPQAPGTGAPNRKRHKSLKRRRLQILLELMGRAEAPERVAAAVALGVGVGFSPFMGFHFFVAILLAFLFRLNKFDAVLGSFAGNPWTLPPVYALGYRLGRAVLGYPPAVVAPLHWQRILHHDFWISFRGPAFRPRLASFLVGTTILSVAAGLGTYLLARAFLKLYHRRHPHVAARAARRRGLASVLPPNEIEILPDDHVH
jgi:uncharacterized protein (DUF2062 family)